MTDHDYRQLCENLIENWLNEPRSSMRIINFLVDQLTTDLYWLDVNISTEDRQILKETVANL